MLRLRAASLLSAATCPSQAAALFLLAAGLSSCAVGRGEGSVTSEHLFSEGCADGPFDLEPNFFASNPFENTQQIRIQRGDKLQETSDGVLISIQDVAAIRGDEDAPGMLGQALRVALPVGVTPPGVPEVADANPALVNMTLYLNDSCHEQDVSLQAISGTITFDSLFSGDITERSSEDRQIEATFDVIFADPRDIVAGGTSVEDIPTELQSRVIGSMSFLFRRGQPAQPFP